MNNYHNAEHYPDPTPKQAIDIADRAEREFRMRVIFAMKNLAELAGYEVDNKIYLVRKGER